MKYRFFSSTALVSVLAGSAMSACPMSDQGACCPPESAQGEVKVQLVMSDTPDNDVHTDTHIRMVYVSDDDGRKVECTIDDDKVVATVDGKELYQV